MKRSKAGVFFISVAAVVGVIVCGLLISERATEKQAHISPGYAREDIAPVLERAKVRAAIERIEAEEQGARRKQSRAFSFTKDDYDFLYHQTGLGRPAVDAAAEKKDSEETFLQTQETFFEDLKFICLRENWVSHREQTVDETGGIICEGNLVGVEDGDILITKSSHIFGWRNGHAALVTDASRRETLEAIVIGENTGNRSFKKWEKYPNVLVLRPKNVDKQTRRAVAKWAEDNMMDVPYQVTAGFFGTKGKILDSVQVGMAADTGGGSGQPEPPAAQAEESRHGADAVGMAGMLSEAAMRRETPLKEAASEVAVNPKKTADAVSDKTEKEAASTLVKGTQCAHLIWRAYAQFGYDLDPNGGWIVTPRQLANSPLLEVVQVYGMNPDQPWRSAAE